jgi:hypothetical protein
VLIIHFLAAWITGVDDTSGDDNEMDFGVDAKETAVHRTNFY